MSRPEVDAVPRGAEMVARREVIARVRVLFETRIVAAGNVQPNPVPACEDNAHGPKGDFQLSHFARREEIGRFQAAPQFDALNGIEQQDLAPVWVDVNEFHLRSKKYYDPFPTAMG